MPREPQIKDMTMRPNREPASHPRDWIAMFFDRPQPEGMGPEWFLNPVTEQEKN